MNRIKIDESVIVLFPDNSIGEFSWQDFISNNDYHGYGMSSENQQGVGLLRIDTYKGNNIFAEPKVMGVYFVKVYRVKGHKKQFGLGLRIPFFPNKFSRCVFAPMND